MSPRDMLAHARKLHQAGDASHAAATALEIAAGVVTANFERKIHACLTKIDENPDGAKTHTLVKASGVGKTTFRDRYARELVARGCSLGSGAGATWKRMCQPPPASSVNFLQQQLRQNEEMKTKALNAQTPQFSIETEIVPIDGNWHPVVKLAISCGKHVRADIFVAGGPAKLRLTRTAHSGRQHLVVVDDLTQPHPFIPLAKHTGTGTAAEMHVGDTLAIIIDRELGDEIGFEFQATETEAGKTPPHISIVGSV